MRMSKKRREQEAKILKQMDDAMQEQSQERGTESATTPQAERTPAKKGKIFGMIEDKTPDEIHCSKCGTLMEKGVCPTCGHRIYVPMSEEKKGKIRFIVTCVAMAIFVVIFVLTQIFK